MSDRLLRRFNIGALLLLLIAAGMNPLRHQIRLDDYANCTGTVDATKQSNTALSTAVAGGKTLFIPTQCIPTLASPTSGTCANGARSGLACTLDTTDQTNGCGIGATCPSCCIFSALAVQNNTHIQCEDFTAGFAPLRQYCSGGTYPGAACKASAECLGGGVCTSSFGVAGTSPCTASTCFAPTSGATYEMLKDASGQSSDIFIEGCSFWTYQSDPYQRCVAGTNAGDPCRQECDGAATSPGARCEAQTDCAGAVPTTPVVALVTIAGNITNGTHSWKVTFVNAAGQGGVSATSAILTADGTHGQVTVNIALGPTGTTSRKIYRRIAGDTGSWLLVGTQADNTTEQFTDNVADGSLGAAVPADTGSLCLRIADCKTPGGTCSGTPNTHPDATVVPPSGPGRINAVDLARTFNASFTRVNVWDHFTGDFGIATGAQATIRDSDSAREITDCSTPLPTSPTTSVCFTTSAAKCCYGAAPSATSNVQPAVAVTNGVSVGTDSQLIRTFGRGSTNAILALGASRLDECTVRPSSASGPGAASGGYSVGALGQVAKSQALFTKSGTAGVTLTGAGGSAIEDRIAGAGAGILLQAANSHAIGNNITGCTSANICIDAQGAYDEIRGNYIEGDTSTEAIRVGASNQTIAGNQINSVAVDTMAIGILTDTSVVNTQITDNQITRVKTAAISQGVLANSLGIMGNISVLSGAVTASLLPSHIVNLGGAATRVIGNHFDGGWHVYTGFGFIGLTNVIFQGNRFTATAGAVFTVGGAGLNIVGNYFNNTSSGGKLSCDASCDVNIRGKFCVSDADCTGTCPSTFDCNPEPVIGYIGDPINATSADASQHFVASSNLMFQGTPPAKQCGAVLTGGKVGQVCTATGTNGTCVDGGKACATVGGVGICAAGGTDGGKACCGSNGESASTTCIFRVPTPMLRVPEHKAADIANTIVGDMMLIGNTIFGSGAATDTVYLDMVTSGSIGLFRINRAQIAGNLWDTVGITTNNVAIKFPTAFSTMSGIGLGDNNFQSFSTPASTGSIANYQGSFGSLLLQTGGIQNSQFPILTTGAQTIFAPLDGPSNGTSATETNEVQVMVGSGTVWKMTCQINATPSNTSTRAFTLRKNLADTTMLCTITNAIKTCTPTAGSASAPIAFTAGDQMDMKQVSVVGTALAAAQGTCAVYVSYDTVM